MTSLDPFPDPKEVVFKGDLRTIDEQTGKFLELDFPTAEFWRTSSYVNAVDNNPYTCWHSFKVPQAGDSFGLRFVKPTTLNRLTITSSKSLTSLEGQLTVLASDHRGVQWVISPPRCLLARFKARIVCIFTLLTIFWSLSMSSSRRASIAHSSRLHTR